MKRAVLILLGVCACLGGCTCTKSAMHTPPVHNDYSMVAGDALGLAAFVEYDEQVGQPGRYTFAGVTTD